VGALAIFGIVGAFVLCCCGRYQCAMAKQYDYENGGQMNGGANQNYGRDPADMYMGGEQYQYGGGDLERGYNDGEGGEWIPNASGENNGVVRSFSDYSDGAVNKSFQFPDQAPPPEYLASPNAPAPYRKYW
jgi:hypothetical protein